MEAYLGYLQNKNATVAQMPTLVPNVATPKKSLTPVQVANAKVAVLHKRLADAEIAVDDALVAAAVAKQQQIEAITKEIEDKESEIIELAAKRDLLMEDE